MNILYDDIYDIDFTVYPFIQWTSQVESIKNIFGIVRIYGIYLILALPRTRLDLILLILTPIGLWPNQTLSKISYSPAQITLNSHVLCLKKETKQMYQHNNFAYVVHLI